MEKQKKLTQLMMLMSLGVKQGDTVTVAANGEDEDAAIETLKAFSKQTCKKVRSEDKKCSIFRGNPYIKELLWDRLRF